MISGIISAVGNVANGLIDSASAKKNTEKTIAHNKQESELAYQREMEMWNRSNEYNTPSAQMQRYMDAGLNPNLMYGQGTAGNTSVSTPQYQPSRGEYNYRAPHVPNMADFMTIEVMQANQDKIKQDTELARQKAVTEAIRQGLYTADTAKRNFDLGVAKNLEQNSYDVAEANLQKLKKQTDLIGWQTANTATQNSLNLVRIQDMQERMKKYPLDREGQVILNSLRELERNFKATDYEIYKSTGSRPGDNIQQSLIRALGFNLTSANNWLKNRK